MDRKGTKTQYFFGSLLEDFFNKYLLSVKGVSKRTADSYRYSFIVFARFVEKNNISPDHIMFEEINAEFIESFLADLEHSGNSVSTRNQRHAALNSYFKFIANRLPELRDHINDLRSVPMKKASHKEVGYIKKDGLELLFSMPNIHKPNGIRDLAMMLLMSIVGLRVSELICIKLQDLNLVEPCTVRIHGKGNKERLVYLPEKLVDVLKGYLLALKLDLNQHSAHLLFANEYGFKFCRQNINRIVERYGKLARNHISENDLDCSLIPAKITPHMLRHSAAMNMLAESSASLFHIKLMLGHQSIQSTQIYAKATSKQVRDSLDSYVSNYIPQEKPIWKEEEVKKTSVEERLKSLQFNDTDDEADKIVGIIHKKNR